MFCQKCGKENSDDATFCKSCGANLTKKSTPTVKTEIRDHYAALFLSLLVPGWGQWYNGKTWDGLIIFGAFLILCIFAVTFSSLFIIIFLIWVYGMYDAYTSADKINRGELGFTDKSRLFWIPVVLIILLLVVVVAAFVYGMIGAISPAPATTTAPSIQVIPQPNIQGWNEHTIPGTHMGIYSPQNWITTSQVVSIGGKEYTVARFASPDLTTDVSAFSMDENSIPGGPAASEKEINQGFIDSDTYQGFMTGISSTNTTPLTNIIQDPNYYSISGHPARKIEFDEGNAHVLCYFVIPDENTLIMELMATTTQATNNDRTEGVELLQSVSG